MHPLIPADYLWLAEALLTALVLGLVFSVLVGGLMLVAPKTLFAMSERVNRWVDTRETFRKLDQPHASERLFYRHHRIVGALVGLGAVFVLWRWLFAVPKATVKIFFLGAAANPQWDWLAPAADWVIIALHLFVLAVGVAVFARPSLLKRVEKTANQWHQVSAGDSLDAVVATLDKGFFLYPRLGGLLLVTGAGGCLVTLVPVLLDHLRG